MIITFEEVSVKAVKTWTENGKRRQKTRKFYQTISPINKNKDGTVKTREQIMTEILAERETWLKEEY